MEKKFIIPALTAATLALSASPRVYTESSAQRGMPSQGKRRKFKGYQRNRRGK